MQIILTSLTGSLCMVNYLFKKFHSGHSTVVMSFVNWVVLVVHTQKYNTCICIKGMVIISCFPVYFFPLLYVLLVFDWTQQFLPWLFTILMVTHLYRGYGVVHETKLICIMNSIILLINFHWHYILMALTVWQLPHRRQTTHLCWYCMTESNMCISMVVQVSSKTRTYFGNI